MRFGLANGLTVLRIVLIPCFTTLLVQRRPAWALVAYLLAATTDFLDGYVARRTQTTRLGRVLDPMADKLMLVSAFIVLALLESIPPWVAVVVISRDVIISLGFLALALQYGGARIEVRPLGKATTLLQSVTVGFVLLAGLIDVPGMAVTTALAVTGLVTAVSGVDYMLAGFRQAGELAEAHEDAGGGPTKT